MDKLKKFFKSDLSTFLIFFLYAPLCCLALWRLSLEVSGGLSDGFLFILLLVLLLLNISFVKAAGRYVKNAYESFKKIKKDSSKGL